MNRKQQRRKRNRKTWPVRPANDQDLIDAWNREAGRINAELFRQALEDPEEYLRKYGGQS